LDSSSRSRSFTVEAEKEEEKEEEEDSDYDTKRKRSKKAKRKVLKVLSTPHKNPSERVIDMPLLQYVFADSVERFYNHNNLKKFTVRL